MNFKGKIAVFILALAAAATVSACAVEGQTKEGETPLAAVPATSSLEEEDQEEEKPVEADPQGALDEIYKSIGRETEAKTATAKEARDIIGLDLDTVDEFYIRYLPADFGASDVYIVRPEDGEDDAVLKALKKRQEERIREFTDYDIYNSTEISENALIFNQGGYIIMLMLEDNQAARTIIEEYIPNTIEAAK